MKNIFYMAMIVASVWMASLFGPKIEGRFFPVVINTQFTEVLADGPTWSTVQGSFDKIRNCSFAEVEFRLGTPSFSAYADMVFLENAKIRLPETKQAFGLWRVQLTPDQLLNRSFATVYHDCHPLWLTETRFYPALVEDRIRERAGNEQF